MTAEKFTFIPPGCRVPSSKITRCSLDKTVIVCWKWEEYLIDKLECEWSSRKDRHFNIFTGDLVLRKASSDVQHKELEQHVIFELGTLHPGGMNVDFSAFIQNRFLPWRRYLATESSAKKPFWAPLLYFYIRYLTFIGRVNLFFKEMNTCTNLL